MPTDSGITNATLVTDVDQFIMAAQAVRICGIITSLFGASVRVPFPVTQEIRARDVEHRFSLGPMDDRAAALSEGA